MLLFGALALIALWDFTQAVWQTPGWWLTLAMAWTGYVGLIWLALAGWRKRR